MHTRRFRPELVVDLDHTLAPFVRGRSDPHTRRDERGTWWRALRTPEGPATLSVGRDGDAFTASAWGPGADWALAAAPSWVGADDSLAGFEPTGLIAELARRFPGVRVPRSRSVFQALMLAILEQKVPGKQAVRGYFGLAHRLGEPAPGPCELVLPPEPARLGRAPSYELRAHFIEERRARLLVQSARRAERLEALADVLPAEARTRLEATPGIGPWTSAEVARIALGDADALSVGDYNLKNLVSYNLTGEPRGSDERMLELLAPYAGHRGRVQLLLEIGGRPVPRFGPRRALPKNWD